MKALFVVSTGALIEFHGTRCTLRCGAGVGLRLLHDADFRLIVLDDGNAAAIANHGSDSVAAGPARRGQPAAPSHMASATIVPAGRLHDNGRRRRLGDAPGAGMGAPHHAGGSDELRRPAAPAGAAHLTLDRLGDLLFREQLALQGYYCCDHGIAHARPGGASACLFRPPQPGLLLQAAFDHDIDLATSWMVGARLDDVEAGNRAGCRTVLLDNGTESTWRLGRWRVPTRIAPDLYGAARLIAEEDDRKRRA
ncbi:HAD hydrolase-like protein [Massilia sp. DWR3-1-1]|uniref:HAD hydrolase-like protein n=1 Tax=Massilia sp. DWR3-1-1 TaxID=2804559 RepID=UPI003CF22374